MKRINYIIVPLIFILIIFLGVEIYKDTKNDKNNFASENLHNLFIINSIENEVKEQNNINEVVKEYPKEDILTEYRGYKVIAKLDIPEIKLETYVLEKYTEDSLNKSVAKYWGCNPNEVGNLCIAGHNAPRNNNMFYNIKNLEVGNRFTISDNIVGKVEYEIYNIYVVVPEDVSCLSQETDGEKEVTLITCTNDSTRRTIVKAREVNE